VGLYKLNPAYAWVENAYVQPLRLKCDLLDLTSKNCFEGYC
jgi:hypothetical protein